MGLIPLKMIADGGKFRLPGKRKVLTRVHDWGIIPVQHYDQNGRSSDVEHRPACYCRNSSGRTFMLDWFKMVEEVSS